MLHPKFYTTTKKKKKLSFKLYFVFSSIGPQFLGHQTVQLNNKQQIVNIRKEKSYIANVCWTIKSKLSSTTQEKQQIYSPFLQKVLRKKNYQLIGMNFNRIKSFQWLQGLIVDIYQEIDKQNKDKNEI